MIVLKDEVLFRGEILDPHGEERRLRRVSNHKARLCPQPPRAICHRPRLSWTCGRLYHAGCGRPDTTGKSVDRFSARGVAAWCKKPREMLRRTANFASRLKSIRALRSRAAKISIYGNRKSCI